MPEKKIAYYLSFGDVIRVLRLIDETPFEELQLDLDGLKLRVVQDKKDRLPAQHTEIEPSASEPPRAAVPESAREQAVAASVPETVAETDGTPVLAPLAGTFYRAPAPGAPPFIEVGTAVKEGDVVGILEIMKLMNHVTAPCSGVVSKICARNEEYVGFGRVLAVITPERAT